MAEIVCQSLDVGQARIFQQDAALQTGLSIAAMAEDVSRTADAVVFIGLDGLAVDLDVFDPPRAGHFDETALIVEDDGTGNRRIDAVRQARDLQETAKFLRIPRSPHFQGIEELLARYAADDELIGKGKDPV